MTNAIGLSVEAPALVVLSLVAGEAWAVPQRSAVVWSVACLVVLGSGGLFVLVPLVMRKWTVSATAYAFVLFPVLTMVVESWLAGEPLTASGLTGAVW